ncbi:cobalt-precorrin-5B (C(1))-methyltransferase CbiD [Spirulina subsalsa FACHB-351]|uniref:Cobalt-precorrin-5B C(1)-methyltransferase n=1 Tax=Spirulina subsalsa FACHB-351 TaxID=234711 RepID=A0ABT3L177_9CYAN|nr:cobalt-precorrin-5B (C(1))-methyltransferase CbiD [Spirulina subsalsa]MCW6035246.1 cobalt-precorrin-5B (C(1))-methyltransferase CbiD [Spirulina subsalsa FACHB-351]
MTRSGYTLPVFACASAVAALRCLQESNALASVEIDLITPPQRVTIEVEQVAPLGENRALAITRSDPGDNLDLTRHTPVWALVERRRREGDEDAITLAGGEGVGRISQQEGRAAIYRYGEQLLRENLQRELAPDWAITVQVILPEGRKLAERTSNAAFGVVEGLSLLGTTGISQPLTSPEQLADYQTQLRQKAQQFKTLVFCVGENGLDLARKMGIESDRLVKTANWLGALLVTAAEAGVESVLLFGYHGKLLKLAGGIFHTHHHLADGRLEILTAFGVKAGLPLTDLQAVLNCETAEQALQGLQQRGQAQGVYEHLAEAIDQRSEHYVRQHSENPLRVGCLLFRRDRTVIIRSSYGTTLLSELC